MSLVMKRWPRSLEWTYYTHSLQVCQSYVGCPDAAAYYALSLFTWGRSILITWWSRRLRRRRCNSGHAKPELWDGFAFSLLVARLVWQTSFDSVLLLPLFLFRPRLLLLLWLFDGGVQALLFQPLLLVTLSLCFLLTISLNKKTQEGTPLSIRTSWLRKNVSGEKNNVSMNSGQLANTGPCDKEGRLQKLPQCCLGFENYTLDLLVGSVYIVVCNWGVWTIIESFREWLVLRCCC